MRSGCYAVCHKQLGDLVLLEPSFRFLRERTGGSIRLLTRSGHAALVELMEGVEPSPPIPWAPARELFAFDVTSKSIWRSLWVPAARKTVILRDPNEETLSVRMVFGSGRVSRPLGESYVADHYLCALGGDGPGVPRLNPPPGDWRPAGLVDEPFLLVNPTAGWKRKCWSSAAWAKVLNALGSVYRGGMILTSGGQQWQREICLRVAAQCSGATVLAGTSLPEFLWLCANAGAIATVDGSATHLARAFDTPAVSLFGVTSPANWHSSSPRHIALVAGEGSRMREKGAIQVEEVVGTLERLLS